MDCKKHWCILFRIIFQHFEKQKNIFIQNHEAFQELIIHVYSDLKLFTGFAFAARIAWKQTVNKAIIIESKPAKINTHHSIFIL